MKSDICAVWLPFLPASGPERKQMTTTSLVTLPKQIHQMMSFYQKPFCGKWIAPVLVTLTETDKTLGIESNDSPCSSKWL